MCNCKSFVSFVLKMHSKLWPQSLPDKTMAGVVEKTEQRLSNKTYYSGTCSFTSLLATRVSEGEYSYSVQFYPGSGTTTVGTLRVG